MDKDKIQAIASWLQPASARGLHGFLGLAGYYRHFIKYFNSLVAPLTQLLRKDSYFWSDNATTSFNALKHALSTAPVLHLPNFTFTFTVDCDASGTGFGVVLHQGIGPLAFFSKPFATRDLIIAAYERELIGLVQDVRHWSPYLWDHKFVVQTDHYALKFILDQRLSTVPQHQWISKLFGFDFSVQFRPGRLNTVANALSRRDQGSIEAHMTTSSGPSSQLYTDLKQELQQHDHLRQLRDTMQRTVVILCR